MRRSGRSVRVSLRIVTGWAGGPAGTWGTMLDAPARPHEPTYASLVPAASPSPAPAGVPTPGASLRSLANPPLIALGLSVLFLLALLVAVMIGSDSDTESADEAGAPVPASVEVGAGSAS